MSLCCKWGGRQGAVWWLDYTVGGNRHRESSRCRKKRDGYRVLRERIGDREAGRLVGRPDRVTLTDLAGLERRTDLGAELERRYLPPGPPDPFLSLDTAQATTNVMRQTRKKTTTTVFIEAPGNCPSDAPSSRTIRTTCSAGPSGVRRPTPTLAQASR